MSECSNPTMIPIYSKMSPDIFRGEVQPKRFPAVLRGVEVGPCVDRWPSVDYIISKTENKPVRVHVSTDPLRMDFRTKNFKYCVTDFHKLVARAAAQDDEEFEDHFISRNEKYYLRHVGDDPRPKNPANFQQDFPKLAEDFNFPSGYFDDESFFSSVLRVSSGGIRVWTHYDVLDNFYVQIVGHKRAVLWAPDQALNLYLDGDKSKVIEIDNPDPSVYPKFSTAQKIEVQLMPGDILFIPAFWFHNMTALDFGVAINVFWKNLNPELYDNKDPYGNKDLLPAAKSLRMLDNVINQLDALPSDCRDFYARQLISKIEAKCLDKPL